LTGVSPGRPVYIIFFFGFLKKPLDIFQNLRYTIIVKREGPAVGQEPTSDTAPEKISKEISKALLTNHKICGILNT